MSEEPSDQGQVSYDEAYPYDPVLALYIDMVEFASQDWSDFGITLTVGGMLVTGDLISGDEYQKATGIAEFVAKFSPTDPDERVWGAQRQFIHLKNAQFFMGHHAGIPTADGVYWRGRLSEIGGFNRGKLRA